MTNWEAAHSPFRSDVPYYQQGVWDAAHAPTTSPLTSPPWSPSTQTFPATSAFYGAGPYAPIRLRYPTFAELFVKNRYSAILLFGRLDVGGPQSCAALVVSNGVASLAYGGPKCKKPIHEYVLLRDSHADNAELGGLSAGTFTGYRAWAAGGHAK